MNTNDLPSQRRPPTQTYARVPKRPKLHHGNRRSHTDDPATHPNALFGREAGDPVLLEVELGTKVDGEAEKREDANARTGGVLQDVPVPVLTNAATMTVEGGGSALVRATKGRTASAPMVGPGVRRGTIEAYFIRMPVKKTGENIGETTLKRVVNTATSTASTATPLDTAVATIEHTVETPSALMTIAATSHTTAASTTSTQTRTSTPTAISSIPAPSPLHKPKPSLTPTPSSAASSPPRASPTLLPTPTTARRKKRRINPTQPPTKKLTQLHLDLGQAPARTSCPICHMSYDPSLPEDTLLHKKFHAKSTGGVDFISSCPRILWSGVGFVQDAWEERERELVIVVGRDSNKLERRRVMEVMEIVERELGCQEIKEEEVFGVPKYDAKGRRGRDRSGDEGGRYKVFLYLLGRKCVGLLLAERIEKAYKITLPPFQSPASTSISPSSATPPAPIIPNDPCPLPPPLPDHPLTLSPTTSPALLGISRIWTCSAHRRRGIATRLLDVARQAFIYGMTIDKSRVAFSQPTALGKALAGEWFLREVDAVESVGEGGVEDGRESFVEERRGGKRVGVEKGGWLVYLDENCAPGG